MRMVQGEGGAHMLDVGQDQAPGSAASRRGDLAGTIRDEAAGYAEKRKADAARIVSDVAEAIRASGSGFSEQPNVKAFFDEAAEGIAEFSEGIAHRTFSELYDEVDAAVRRRPGVTVAAAALAGLALVRWFRASGIRPIPRSRAVVSADVFPTPEV
jgi:hypothetical protein